MAGGNDHIHAAGLTLKEAFEGQDWGENVTLQRGARGGPNPGPDITFNVEGDAAHGDLVIPLELKKRSTGISQIRSLRYETLVVSEPPYRIWWVLPPHEVVKIVAQRAGQHSRNSFECCNPGLAFLNGWECNTANLHEKIVSAYIDGGNSPIENFVTQVTNELDNLFEAQKERLAQLIEEMAQQDE